MQTQNNRKRSRNGSPKKQKTNKLKSESMVIIPFRSGPVADRYRCHLKFWQYLTLNLSATSYVIKRFRPTSAFDMDPDAGGTSPPGFAELATLYRSYRVRAANCVVQGTSTSADDLIQLTLCPVNHDPGTSPSPTYYTSLRENPRSISKGMPPKGGPLTVLNSGFLKTEQVYGNPMTEYDDSFAALVTAVPDNNWFWIISAYCPIVVPEPVLVTVSIEVEIDFYDRAFLYRT